METQCVYIFLAHASHLKSNHSLLYHVAMPLSVIYFEFICFQSFCTHFYAFLGLINQFSGLLVKLVISESISNDWTYIMFEHLQTLFSGRNKKAAKSIINTNLARAISHIKIPLGSRKSILSLSSLFFPEWMRWLFHYSFFIISSDFIIDM